VHPHGAAWLPQADPHTLLIVLAGALGIHPEEYEDVPRPTGDHVATHGAAAGRRPVAGPPAGALPEDAFAEIARIELMDGLRRSISQPSSQFAASCVACQTA
jgi:hypothetical protein